MRTHTIISTLYWLAALTLLMGVGSAFFAHSAMAAMPEDAAVSVSGMTVTVSFTRSTPCAPYTLDWDDGETEEVGEIEEMCIQVIDEKTVRHTYEEEGEYTITLAVGGEEYTETVSVPGEELSFTLSDVESVTSRWVDPFAMMADEEYYVYTIMLEDGGEVVVEVPGFTLEEYRIEQFRNAGYTGDIDALIAMADSDTDDETPVSEGGDTALYQELVSTLQSLIAAMQSLLELRQA